MTHTYLIATDAACRHCGEVHGYATQNCTLAVWVDWRTAQRVMLLMRRHGDRSAVVRPLDGVPTDAEGNQVSHILFTQIDGKPDPRYPRKLVKL